MNPLDLNHLFQRAVDEGTIGAEAAAVIAGDLGPLVLAGAAGMAAEDIQASDVTLVTLLVDASSSIGDRGLEDAVRHGQHGLLDAFAGASAGDSVLVALWTFATDVVVVHGYVPVGDATRLDAKTYRAGGTTRLYDAFCDAAAANVAYAQTLRDAGTPTRSLLVVVTDGEDVSSKRSTKACAKLAQALLQSEQFLLGFVGVGADVDFVKTARAMGFPPGSTLVEKDATPQSLRRAFALVSRSAVQASRGRVTPGAGSALFSP